jgi:putative nucleotidyltransferase with HDIG domain
MTGMSRAARGYATIVACAGVAACVAAAPHVRNWDYVLGLAVLWVALSSLSMVVTSRGSVLVSLGFVISIAAIFLTGVPGAVLVSAASVLEYHRGGLPLLKRAFNGAQFALAGGAGAYVYALLGGPVNGMRESDFPGILGLTTACVAAYVLVNYCLVAAVVHLDTGVPFFGVWWGSISWATSSFFAYGLLGLLIAMMWENVNPLAALLMLLPLLIARATYYQYAQQQHAYEGTLRALIQAVETKDHYTRGHSERVAAASVLIAREVGMREDRVEALRYAGMLHDVGKTGVPTKVLQKAGRLTEDEAEAIRQHTTRGYELLREIDFLAEALAGIYHHHERLDGQGYPLGLSGYDIPEFARVIAVADAFDSMTSTRSYRAAKDVPAAVAELLRCRGSQFDPLFVDALVRGIERKGWQTEPGPRVAEAAMAGVAPTDGSAMAEHDA